MKKPVLMSLVGAGVIIIGTIVLVSTGNQGVEVSDVLETDSKINQPQELEVKNNPSEIFSEIPTKGIAQNGEDCRTKSNSCYNRIVELLRDLDKYEKLVGLNMLWLQMQPYSKDEVIKSELKKLREFQDFHVKELAKFISMRMGHWPEAEVGSMDNSETLSQFNGEGRQLTSADTEASRSDSFESVKDEERDHRQAMQSQDANLKIEVVEKLVSVRSDDTLEILKKALNDTDASVRLAAVDGLGLFLDEGYGNGDDIARMLQERLNDENAEISKISRDLLKRYEKIKPEPVDSIDPQI